MSRRIERRHEIVPNTVFPGIDGPVQRTDWRYLEPPAGGGSLWEAIDGDGIHWVSDGDSHIAAMPERTFRFFYRGIGMRCAGITGRYLRDGLVPIPQGSVVVNFGANIGEVAIVLEQMGASVIAIEPDPGVLPYLCANARDRNISVVPAAAWNRSDTLSIFLKPESADTSVFNRTDRNIIVRGVRIDDVAKSMGVERIHLICGDAEGAEPEVLEGAPLAITDYVSICASKERAGVSTLSACEDIIVKAGFEILHKEETGFCMLIGRNKCGPSA